MLVNFDRNMQSTSVGEAVFFNFCKREGLTATQKANTSKISRFS
jgi:hypothetical protein